LCPCVVWGGRVRRRQAGGIYNQEGGEAASFSGSAGPAGQCGRGKSARDRQTRGTRPQGGVSERAVDIAGKWDCVSGVRMVKKKSPRGGREGNVLSLTLSNQANPTRSHPPRLACLRRIASPPRLSFSNIKGS
jgi:hypothetical protein